MRYVSTEGGDRDMVPGFPRLQSQVFKRMSFSLRWAVTFGEVELYNVIQLSFGGFQLLQLFTKNFVFLCQLFNFLQQKK